MFTNPYKLEQNALVCKPSPSGVPSSVSLFRTNSLLWLEAIGLQRHLATRQKILSFRLRQPEVELAK